MREIVGIDRLRAKTHAQIHTGHRFGGRGNAVAALSRAFFPKQFLPLVSERTLFQETVLRDIEDTGFASPIVVRRADGYGRS